MSAMTGSARARRIRRFVTTALGLASAAVLVDACVIADPPTDLPRPSERRPTIVRASVVPSTSSVLGTWPGKVIVPVELSDPLAEITWATFINYNPVTGEGFIQDDTSKYEPASTRGNIRLLEIPISVPSSDRCLFIEVIVALRLNTRDPRNAHTPEEPGGDSVGWFFSPSGDLAGCPVLDAGLQPLPDSGADADAGGGV